MTGLQFVLDAEHAPLLDAALAPFLRRMREAGIRVPADIEDLAKWARAVATGFSSPPGVPTAEDGPMALLLSLPKAADELGCSPSKVKKLIAEGRLPAVDFDGVRRVHRDDVVEFARSLRPATGVEPVPVDLIGSRRNGTRG